MSITSVTFLLFVLVLVGVYYIVPLKRRWGWLLVCSVFFYVSYDWILSLWILGIALLINTEMPSIKNAAWGIPHKTYSAIK